MNSPVSKIKERLSIEDVVSSYIKLDRVGTNFKAKCPFHNEKTASFFISPDRGSYYCFGCAAKGDIFTFVEEFEGLDFKGALKLLADKAGVVLERFNFQDSQEESEKEKLYKVMEEATKYYSDNLQINNDALFYLKSRNLTNKTIMDFRIGYANLSWHDLYNHLQKKGFNDKLIEKAGLIKQSNKNISIDKNNFYDRFRGRIMFPISDSSGRVIAFSGRLLKEETLKKDGQTIQQAKYLNSPDTPIFNKSSILYGLNRAKEFIHKNDFSIVVEGQFDLILSHQAGFKNTVATSGTALTDSNYGNDKTINHLGVLKRLSNNIVFIFDSDKAGLSASLRAMPIALALFNDMNVKSTQVPEGMDPADLISQRGVEAWRKVIRDSKHIIEFLVDKFIVNLDKKDSLKIKIDISEKIIPYLNYIKNPIKRAHFMLLISDKSGIHEDVIKDIANSKLKENERVENITKNFEEEHRRDYILKRLLGIILWQNSLKNPRFDTNSTLEKVCSILKNKPQELLAEFKNKKEDLMYEAEVFYGDQLNLNEDIKELLSNLEEEYINEELLLKLQELNIVEGIHDKIKISETMAQINELNKRKQDIKNGRSKK